MLKLKMLEIAYKIVDPTTCELKTKELEKNLNLFFKAYQQVIQVFQQLS